MVDASTKLNTGKENELQNAQHTIVCLGYEQLV